MNSDKNWKDVLDNFSIEQRLLIEGGHLSSRFSTLPLTLSHPVFIGAFYGLLLSIILLLPFGYDSDWNLREWMFVLSLMKCCC